MKTLFLGVGTTGCRLAYACRQQMASSDQLLGIDTEGQSLKKFRGTKRENVSAIRAEPLAGKYPERGCALNLIGWEQESLWMRAVIDPIEAADCVCLYAGIGRRTGSEIGYVLARLVRASKVILTTFLVLPTGCEGSRITAKAREYLPLFAEEAHLQFVFNNKNVLEHGALEADLNSAFKWADHLTGSVSQLVCTEVNQSMDIRQYASRRDDNYGGAS